jgi:hypothetical protein
MGTEVQKGIRARVGIEPRVNVSQNSTFPHARGGISQISEIGVIRGLASRLGLEIANAFAWLEHLPVIFEWSVPRHSVTQQCSILSLLFRTGLNRNRSRRIEFHPNSALSGALFVDKEGSNGNVH